MEGMAEVAAEAEAALQRLLELPKYARWTLAKLEETGLLAAAKA